MVAFDPESSRTVKVDPYPDKTPRHILEREYLILDLALQNGAQTTFWPAKSLYLNETIKDYLKLFRFVRASVQIRIIILSTPMQYGGLLVSKLPNIATNDAATFSNIYQRVQSDCTFLDITEQNALVLDLPYLKPILFDEVKTVQTTTFNDWRVNIHVAKLDTITMGAPTTIGVKVFAHFYDIQASGYKNQEAQFQANTGNYHYYAQLAERLARHGTTAAVGAAGGALWHTLEKEFPAAGELYKGVTKLMGTENNNEKQMKLDLGSNLSAPTTGSTISGAHLGDARQGMQICLPSLHNQRKLLDLVRMPTYVGTYDLLTTADTFTLDCTPSNLLNSYLSYIMRTFRYYRGGMTFYFRIMCSPLISARVRFILYPANEDAPPTNSSTIGDMPTWIHTIKGPCDWALSVPYFQPQPWVVPGTEYVQPKLVVGLIDSVSRPFDKPVAISLMVFAAAAEDFQFAGLQSSVPPKLEAQFQCSISGMVQASRLLGSTDNFSYMGGVETVNDVIARFSTRKPGLAYPFPIQLTTWSEVYETDLFDWYSNLYAFYTGDIKVKVLFAKAPANGMLEMTLASRLTPKSTGDTFKTGNSYTMTHQGVWPMLEYVYPYMNTYEFEALRGNLGIQFGEKFSETSEISKYMIAPGDNFQLFYLMPLPDFYFTAETVEREEATFQSGSGLRYPFDRTFVGQGTFVANVVTPFSTLITTDTMFNDRSFYLEASVSIFRMSGSTDNNLWVQLAATGTGFNPAAAPAIEADNTYLISPAIWVDITNSGKFIQETQLEGSFYNKQLGSNLYLNVISPPGGTSTFGIAWTIRVSPWKNSLFLVNPENFLNRGKTDGTVQQDTTWAVSVSNTPNVTITGQPIQTTITDVVPVTVNNIVGADLINQPIRVMFDEPQAVTARVQGIISADTPVWTTLYGSN